MKKQIAVIGMALVGLVLFASSNSWAGGHHRGHRHAYHHDHRVGPRHFKWHHGPGYRHHPKRFHRGHRGPFHRHRHAGCFRGHRHRTVVKQINNYYGRPHSGYVYDDHYYGDSSYSGTSFSFSFGISGTR